MLPSTSRTPRTTPSRCPLSPLASPVLRFLAALEMAVESTEGRFPSRRPLWTRRTLGGNRHWFYRCWFHSSTIPWDHDMVPYFRQTRDHILDRHPSTNYDDFHYCVWFTPLWPASLIIWEACNHFETQLAINTPSSESASMSLTSS